MKSQWKQIVQLQNGMYVRIYVVVKFQKSFDEYVVDDIDTHLDDGDFSPLDKSEIIPKHLAKINERAVEHSVYHSIP